MNITDIKDQSIEPIDLRQYIYLLWQWAWLIILVSILVGGATYLFSRQQTPIYQATTRVIVNAAPSTMAADYTSILASQNLTSTYAQMISSQPVMEEVASRLGGNLTPSALQAAVSAQPVSGTQLIYIAVRLTDATQAAAVANTTAQVFSEQIEQMQSARFTSSSDSLKAQMAEITQQINTLTQQANTTTDKAEQMRLQDQISQDQDIYSRLLVSYEQVRLTEAQTVSSISQVEKAIVPVLPVSPRIWQNTQLAFLVGGLLAVIIVFLIEALNDTIHDPELFMQKFHLSILGVIAHHEQQEGSPITGREPRSPVSEAFRSLRTNVQYASVDQPLRTLLVTSATPTDGKSTISSNLAVVLAQGGMKVCVIDADLRRPKIHHIFGVQNQIGLSELFMQPVVHLISSMQKNPVENVSVISSGRLPPNPAELLASKKMREILEVVLDQSDIVILDTPPVLSVTDAVVLSQAVDGVLLVVRPGSTKQTAFRQAVQQLNQVGANLLGVVINEAGQRGFNYNYYYRKYYKDQYAYRSAYSENGHSKKKRFMYLLNKRG